MGSNHKTYITNTTISLYLLRLQLSLLIKLNITIIIILHRVLGKNRCSALENFHCKFMVPRSSMQAAAVGNQD